MLGKILIYVIIICILIFLILTSILAYNLYKWVKLTKEVSNDVDNKLREIKRINERLTELQSIYKEGIKLHGDAD